MSVQQSCAPLGRRELLVALLAAPPLLFAYRALAQTGALQDEDEAEIPDDPLLATALSHWTGDLDGMVERGMLRIAIPFGLTTYFLDGPDQRGLTYEFALKFEEFLKKRLGKQAARLTLVVIPTSRDRLFPMVTEGLVDIAAGSLTITPDRLAIVDFSDPFGTNVREVLVTGPAAPDIRTAEDLLGTPIHIRRSSSFYEHLRDLNDRRIAEGKEPFLVVEADEKLTTDDFFEMVSAGMFPATIGDDFAANFFVQVFDNLRIHDDLVLADNQSLGWAFRKNSPQLKEAVNAFVDTARKGTQLGNILLAKYLKNTKWVENALAPGEREKFKATVGLIKTYADRYEFDWLMIGAQAYQESRLDQSKRSPVGAIGIMQVMPQTARDPNVGIPDIHITEPNVHAGVKYLRFVRDQYFSDPELTELDQTLFSFAAYNAGPGNIRKARRHAGKLGLDPNVWLDNVEIAAGKVISREPVVYVRNIYKYYIAYKSIGG
ncbi:MAG TPA: transporter substrate-binding domain-containing protein [Alphaproteobacteria bacterium]|nr:transporter substrate-binding domain-containing protein [Alphaproteobacteria bacterium]